MAFASLQQTLEIPASWSSIDIANIAVSSVWKGLGPFKVGTREAIWGADPLEAFGGFEALLYERNTRFHSALAPNATVTWADHEAYISQTTDSISLEWSVNHENIDWSSMQQVYGWGALQYQTWIRGEILNKNPHPVKVTLKLTNILEYSFNGKRFFGGDFYGFHRAPTVVELRPGSNTIDIRLLRDVRALGGESPPVIQASLTIEPLFVNLRIVDHSLIAPEIFEGMLPSPYVGITVQNLGNSEIKIFSCDNDDKPSDLGIVGDAIIKLMPGQARPLALFIKSNVWVQELLQRPAFARICYCEATEQHAKGSRSLDFIVLFKQRLRTEAHRFTFLHPSTVVSYAILKAPADVGQGKNVEKEFPILVALHGAGLEADSEQVRHALDAVSDLPAFFLFPTGMSSWSGDDWHTWGLADVMAAISAVKDWQQAVGMSHVTINTERVFMSGHSNGGQGTWYFATHLPDRTFAAAPVSGYTSIENYVPYDLWNIADQDTILANARRNFRNELLIENLVDIPIMQQHGSLDDNVPPYHSRLMSSLRAQAHLSSDYVELEGQRHWWDGAMVTTPLENFYALHLSAPKKLSIPDDFVVAVPNSADFGSKFGIVVDQLQVPDRMGRIMVHVNKEKFSWHVRTVNIHRFHLDFSALPEEQPKLIYLDTEPESRPTNNRSFVLSPLGTWVAQETEWRSISTRSGSQRGALEAILRSNGIFEMVDFSTSHPDLLVQTSLNLLQYFGAAANIVGKASYANALSASGNVITFAIGEDVPSPQWPEYPVRFTKSGIILMTSAKPNRLIEYSPGLGAVFLRPLAKERLELLIWGTDKSGLQQAMRMIPTLTGGGQPDFVILDQSARWKGHGGAVALGFFDHEWTISGASYL